MGKVAKLKVDFFALAKQFCGQWVALDPKTQTVIASAPTAVEAVNRASQYGEKEPLVFKVLDDYGAIAPCLVRY